VGSEHWKIPVEKLCNYLDPKTLKFKTTDEVKPLEGLFGQERALRALDIGLQADSNAFNLYVAGQVGTGKMTAVKMFLSKLAPQRPTPQDWVYVYNFESPDNPQAIALHAGMGPKFAKDMDKLVEQARQDIPRAFKSENYEHRKDQVLKDIEARRAAISDKIQTDARQAGFALQPTPLGMASVPLKEGRPMTADEFSSLPQEEQKHLEEAGEKVKDELEQALREARDLETMASERIETLDKEITLLAIGPLLDALRNKYRDFPEVITYLNQVQTDIPEHLEDFRQEKGESGEANPLASLLHEDHTGRYKVNVLVERKPGSGAPVVVEFRPTYYNVLGRVDYRARLSGASTDFTMIKAGAIHRANGGYLVVEAKELLTSPYAWEALKRTLRSGEVSIENLGDQYTIIPTASLRPEPIPINLKVVMVGSSYIYYLLYYMDEDFKRLFSVRADFDIEMDRDEEHINDYAGFIAGQVKEKSLKPFDRTGVARIIDFASRDVDHQERLSARLLDIGKLVTEASYWAAKNGDRYVTGDDVQTAIREREHRSDLMESKLRRAVKEGVLHISTTGENVGQVNGLSVMMVADHPFGNASRVTARTFMGTRGVANIDREIKLSGPIHSKGFLILTSYLAGKYAQDKPLAVSGNITFEQTYDEIEGDSASSTELYCLLSSLSGLPLKQGVAVTGSVNQHGEVQAIGGVNQKIEGFYELAKAAGLTGEQGVMIPADNVMHLMLKDEVVQAVKDGKFNLWAVKTIDEGIELLTGVPAGQVQADGRYPEGTVHQKVNQRLVDYANRLKEFERTMPSGRPSPMVPPGEEKQAADSIDI
jgi:lon-related putative ATP-dependent protease